MGPNHAALVVNRSPRVWPPHAVGVRRGSNGATQSQAAKQLPVLERVVGQLVPPSTKLHAESPSQVVQLSTRTQGGDEIGAQDRAGLKRNASWVLLTQASMSFRHCMRGIDTSGTKLCSSTPYTSSAAPLLPPPWKNATCGADDEGTRQEQ